MKTFYKLLGITLITATTNNFVWFALTYWIYLETKSVISTSTLGGIWLVATAVSGFWFGSIVDHNKKKTAMIGSSIASLFAFTVGFFIYNSQSKDIFTTVGSPILWIFALVLLTGVIAGSIYQIAIPTLVGHIVPPKKQDRANGMTGTILGTSFAITSVASGFTLAYGGMFAVLLIAIIFTLLAIIVLYFIKVPEKEIIHTHEGEEPQINKSVDIKGTISVIKATPGLFALIFYTTFNNFLGGVFMSLMDAYGLTLVSVQTWGLLWGFLSFGFIWGGLYISKKGLGDSPLNNLFKINTVLWTVCIFFTIQPSIILLAVGCLIWISLVPFVEATEQTILQKVVPPERLGRVFGFAHSVEQSASPVTAFFIGPIAQFVFIPFMTTGKGVELIGDWFGTGTGRGIALVFITAGLVGLIVTSLAKSSNSYKLLAERYRKSSS